MQEAKDSDSRREQSHDHTLASLLQLLLWATTEKREREKERDHVVAVVVVFVVVVGGSLTKKLRDEGRERLVIVIDFRSFQSPLQCSDPLSTQFHPDLLLCTRCTQQKMLSLYLGACVSTWTRSFWVCMRRRSMKMTPLSLPQPRTPENVLVAAAAVVVDDRNDVGIRSVWLDFIRRICSHHLQQLWLLCCV